MSIAPLHGVSVTVQQEHVDLPEEDAGRVWPSRRRARGASQVGKTFHAPPVRVHTDACP